jgi:hypothetical protein
VERERLSSGVLRITYRDQLHSSVIGGCWVALEVVVDFHYLTHRKFEVPK